MQDRQIKGRDRGAGRSAERLGHEPAVSPIAATFKAPVSLYLV